MGIIQRIKEMFGGERLTLADAGAGLSAGKPAGIKDLAARYQLTRRKSPIDFFANGLEKYGWIGSYHGLALEVHELRVMECYLGEISGGVLLGLRRAGPDSPLPPPDSPQRVDAMVGDAGREAARQYFLHPVLAPPERVRELLQPEVLSLLTSLSPRIGGLLIYDRGVQLNLDRKRIDLDALDRDLERTAEIVAVIQRLHPSRER